MSSRKGKKEGARSAAERQHELVQLLRSKAQRWMRVKNVTSVGVGFRLDDAGQPTDELCIQFTVEKKLAPEALEAEGIELLPETITDEQGLEVRVQVLERRYAPSHLLLEPEVEPSRAEREEEERHTERSDRRSRRDPICPGISIGHKFVSAGTAGAIVYDSEDGRPYVLSNWHVLHAAGQAGDEVLQPGTYDGGRLESDRLGRLVRSHIGLAGDCAIASIEGRAFDEKILGLDVVPSKVARAELGDRVVKSGRTTGVTRGVVSRIGVVVKLSYDLGTTCERQYEIGGFEIRPAQDDPQPPANGEISTGGDSGSLWLVADDSWAPTEIAVGLHFAGETDPRPTEEHALACNLHSVLEKLGVALREPEPVVLSEEQLWNRTLGALASFGQRLRELELASASQAVGSRYTAQESCDCRRDENARGSERAAGAEVAIPIYGNWCGPGHGGGTPVDAVDEACQRHDRCYAREGYFDCGCDAELVRELDRAIASGGVSAKGRAAGALIRAWFALQPCVSRRGGSLLRAGEGQGNVRAARANFVKSVGRGAERAWKLVKGEA